MNDRFKRAVCSRPVVTVMCEEVWLTRSLSCEDITAAISLPIIVEQEEGSLHTDEYFDRKRHQHEKVLTNMRDEIEKLNDYVDNEVEQFIEVAKEECKLIEQEIQKNNFDEIKSVEQWLSVSNKNNKQKSYISKITNELALDLESFENSRSKDLRNILSKYKYEAIVIRFMSAEDIEKIFEEEIKNINLNMVKAFRRYEDVNVQLQVVGQGIIDECQKNVKEKSRVVAEQKAQDLWKKVLEKQSRKLLNGAIYNLTQERFRVREDFSEVANSLAKGLSDFAEGLQLPTEYDMRGEYWEQWIESLNSRLASLDTLCKSIEQLLKSAVNALMENLDHQVNDFFRTMGIEPYNQLEEFENDFKMSNEVEELRKRQARELNILKGNWQETVNELQTKIERSKTFVFDLTAIWTTHLARVNELHAHIETVLESSYYTSLKKYKENDSKLKGLVKSVREAKDVPKLNALCETLKDKFQDQVVDLEDSYETQLEMMEEMKRKGVEELIKEKKAHINDFLNNKYRKKEWFFDGRKSESIGSISLTGSDYKIEGQIDLCKTYMTAVENRTLGMYEMLERYVPNCETSVKEETEDWMNMFIQDIVNNYDSQVNEVNERQIKTLQDIKQIRFAEIQIHSRRLISHINGAKHEFSELNKRYENDKTKQTQSLKEFNEMVASRLSKENMKGTKNVLMELEQEWNCLSEALTNRISTGKTLCEKKYADVKEANSLFLKTAKNFKNGGNYSPEELKTLNKEINQVGKFVLAQNKTIQKNYDNLAKLISRNILDSKIEQMNEEMKAVRLEQSIVDTLSTLRMRLRSEINTMKSKTKSIEEKMSLFVSNQRIDSDLLNSILTSLSQTHDYMMFPEGVLSLECTKVGESLATTTPSTGNKVQETKKTVVLKQNIDPLFKHTTDEVLSDGSNFLSLTKGLILKKYYHLLQAIRDKSVVTHPEVIKPKSTDSKQKGVKQKLESGVATQQTTLLKHVLRSYNSECELVWLSQTREILDQTVTLRKIFDAVAELELKKNHENYMKSLDRLEREYLYSVNEGESKREADRERVQRSLVLPLAHPANHLKLSELREKVKNLGRLQKNEFKAYLKKYNDDLQNKHDSYVKVIKTLKDRLNDHQTVLFSEDLCKTLIENSKDIRNVIPYEDEIGEETLNANPVYTSSIWSDGRDLDQDSQTPRSICLILLPTSSKTSYESLSDGPGGAARVSIDRVAVEQVKESAQQVQKLYDRATDLTEEEEQTVKKWLKTFEHGVKEAKLVYKWPCDS